MKNKTSIFAWCLYDWACSAFPIIITTFIFATYFTTQIAANPIQGTHQWANATALAGILIALLSPVFGAIADHSGHHKIWLFVFTIICVIASGLLWFAYPSTKYVDYTLTWVVIGTVALEIAVVFYNAFLPKIAPEDYIGRISGWAWALGYFGGIVCLGLSLYVFIQTNPNWLQVDTAEQVRICGPLVAIWFFIFAIPLFIFTKSNDTSHENIFVAIKKGLITLKTTIKTLPRQSNLFIYLIAHLIYADGLNTLFAFGGIYAAGTFNMNLPTIMLFGITMDITAGIGAFLLAWMDDYLGSKPTILLSITGLTLLGIPLLFVQSRIYFWIIALALSIFLGPVQAASRSLMARLSPKERSIELFGLYSFSGKITAFMGPWLLGFATDYFHTQRAGMATILLFFVVGGVMMYFVQEKKPIKI